MYQDYYVAPIGILELKSSEIGLTSLKISSKQLTTCSPNEFITLAKAELDAYFKRDLRRFTVPLDWSSASPFFRSVWQVLLDIPLGEVRTYQEIAVLLNKPKASRAVGMANAKNSIAIIVPCHRVIGANGSLTGYAYGKAIKKVLLTHEGVNKLSNTPDLFS